MVKLTIDSKVVEVPEGTTILNAAKSAQIKIPTLCHHPDLPPTAACGICIVKSNGRMVRSCCTPVAEGMEVSDDEVTVAFRTNHIKYVDLQINTLGTPAEGYELTNIQMSFKQVILKGAQDILDKVNYIRIPNTYLPIYGSSSNVTIEVNLEEFLPEGTEIYDNNRNVYITAVIEKSEETTGEAETEEEQAQGGGQAADETEPSQPEEN